MADSASVADDSVYEQLVKWGREQGSDDLAQALAKLIADLSTDRSRLLFDILAVLELDETRALEAASLVAARHRALTHSVTDVRNLLALCASQGDFARQIAGDPRDVIDDVKNKLLNRARWRGEAMAAIWQEPMLEPRVAAVALGVKPSNRERLSQYRKRSRLLGLPFGRGYLYPEFQFDPGRSDVYAVVRAVNELLDAAGDPWGVASWWFSSHAGLGARPADLVGTGPEPAPAALGGRPQAADRRDDWAEDPAEDPAGDLLAAAHAVIEPIG